MSQVEADFRKELADAETWYAAVRADELKWIEQGVDVDAEFDKNYFREPKVGGDPDGSTNFRAAASVRGTSWSLLAVAIGGILGVLAVIALVYFVLTFLALLMLVYGLFLGPGDR